MKKPSDPKANEEVSENVYVAPHGNDATGKPNDPGLPYARFDTALKVAASLPPGSTVVSEMGGYDVDYVLDIPHNVNLRGNGAHISSLVDLNVLGPTIVMGDNTLVTDLIVNTPLDRQFNAAMGSYEGKGCKGARVRNCRLYGSTDAVYLRAAGAMKEITFEDCILRSPWDGVAMFDSDCRLTFMKTLIDVCGPPGFTTDAPQHGIILRGNVIIQNSIINVTGPNPENVGIWNTRYGANATIYVCGTSVICTGRNAQDIVIDPSSSYVRENCCPV